MRIYGNIWFFKFIKIVKTVGFKIDINSKNLTSELSYWLQVKELILQLISDKLKFKPLIIFCDFDNFIGKQIYLSQVIFALDK